MASNNAINQGYPAVDGQLNIGNTSIGAPTLSTLTAGSGVTITNGNGSITIASSGSSGLSLGQAYPLTIGQFSN